MDSLHITTFPDVRGQIAALDPWDIEKLQTFPPTAEEKAGLPLLKLADFGGQPTASGCLRHDANVTAVWGAELDYDAGEKHFDTAREKLEAAGVEAFLYTSPSHTTDSPHWRILLPFDEPFSGTVEQMRSYRSEAVRRVEKVLGFEVANESHTLSQAFYYGRVDGTQYQTAHTTGKCVDRKYNLNQPVAKPKAPGFVVGDNSGVDIQTQVALVLSGDSLHESLRSLSASYAAKGMSEADIVDTLRGHLDASKAKGSKRWQERYDAVPRLVTSAVEKYAPEATEAAQAMPDQLPELDVPALLKTQPEPRAFHFTDSNGAGVLPEGEGCGAAGPGGVGKSTVMLQLCVALATGQLWMGEYKPSYRVPVFFFTKEDSRDELHRRLWAITGDDREALDVAGLHVYPLLGVDFPLTVSVNGQIVPGPAVDRIIEIVNQHGGGGVVSLDPLRKMAAGKEDGEAMSAAVNACDKIRLHTSGDCTTLLVHHSSKESMRNQDATAGAFRGATDLVDGLRWTMALTKLSPKDRSQLTDGNNWRRITMPKTNYTEANDDGVLVAWEEGRFMVQATPTSLQKTHTIKHNARQLYGVLLESGPLTFRELRDKCHKDNGPVYAATREAEAVINTGMQLKLIRATKVTRANRQSYEAWEAREDAPEM